MPAAIVSVVENEIIVTVEGSDLLTPLVSAAALSADLSEAWAEGTLPGGIGTKSSKEWAEDAEAAAAVATAGNITVIGTPGELVVNEGQFVLRRTTATESVDTGSAARDLATRQAEGAAYVEALVRHYGEHSSFVSIAYGDEHHQISGQSLSLGSDSRPWYVDALDYVVMPNGGFRYLADGDPDPDISFASIEPGLSGPREVGFAAFGKMFGQLLLEENRVDIATTGKRFLGSCIGEGSTSITQLTTAPLLARVLADWEAGQAATGANGKVTPASHIWIQGEKDADLGTSQSSYNTALGLRQTNVQSNARTATSDAGLIVPLLTYQVATHVFYAEPTPSVALAQLALAKTNPLIAMATPAYPFTYVSTSNVHLLSTGYIHMFAYFGMAWKRWSVDRVKPMPLCALSTTVDGDSIYITYDVGPQRSLVLDSTTLANQGDYGFATFDAADAPLTISEVSIVGKGDTIRIKHGSNPPSDAQWRYAWETVSGPAGRGNLRDNSPIIFGEGEEDLPMWKWAAIDEGQGA